MLEANKIYLGDCLEIMNQIPEKSIDMVLCDLPYGTTACSWDIVIPFEKLWKQYERIIKADGAIVLFGSQPFTSMLVASNLKMFKHEWIWEKQKAGNFMGFKYQPAKYHENILVFGKGKIKYHPIMWEIEHGKVDKRKIINNPKVNKVCHLGEIVRVRNKDTGWRYPKSIIKINKSINGNIHPTQKPIELCEYLIKTYTNEGDTVLDNCIGSGTTAIAAVRTDRKFIGIESEPIYFDICSKRIFDEMKGGGA